MGKEQEFNPETCPPPVCGQNLVLVEIWVLFCFRCAMQHVGSYFHDQGSNPCPPQWKRGVLSTEPPGKSNRGFEFYFPPHAMLLMGIANATTTSRSNWTTVSGGTAFS